MFNLSKETEQMLRDKYLDDDINMQVEAYAIAKQNNANNYRMLMPKIESECVKMPDFGAGASTIDYGVRIKDIERTYEIIHPDEWKYQNEAKSVYLVSQTIDVRENEDDDYTSYRVNWRDVDFPIFTTDSGIHSLEWSNFVKEHKDAVVILADYNKDKDYPIFDSVRDFKKAVKSIEAELLKERDRINAQMKSRLKRGGEIPHQLESDYSKKSGERSDDGEGFYKKLKNHFHKEEPKQRDFEDFDKDTGDDFMDRPDYKQNSMDYEPEPHL